MGEENKLVPSNSYSAAQQRVLAAAMELFCAYGVAGTSLQMIAAAMGVTKAAIYHQFKTKDAIVLATGKGIAEKVEGKIKLAEAQPTKKHKRHVLVDGLIILAVENRRVANFLQHDPVMLRFINEHETYRKLTTRMNALLLDKNNNDYSKACVAMLTTSIGGAVRHPLVAEVADQVLFEYIRKLAYLILDQVE